MRFRIFTDSCCDFPKSYVDEHEITALPLSFIVEGKEYLDDFGQSMTPKDYYAMLRSGKNGVTSQVNTERFIDAFTKSLEAGEDILYIGFSSALSGTCSSAMLAANLLKDKYPDRKIYIVDSLCASLGQGLLIHQAVALRDAARPIEEVVAWLEKNKLRLNHWFTVDDLNFLKRGGRLSGTMAFLGTILDIKPVLHVNMAGRLVPVTKVKGRKRALRSLVDYMVKMADPEEEQTVFISHGDCEEDAQAVAAMVREKFKVKEILIHFVGPVIGSHSGPGTVALFFMGKPREEF